MCKEGKPPAKGDYLLGRGCLSKKGRVIILQATPYG